MCIRDRENVKNLYRKTLEEASQQEIFQAVSYTVKDVIIDEIRFRMRSGNGFFYVMLSGRGKMGKQAG